MTESLPELIARLNVLRATTPDGIGEWKLFVDPNDSGYTHIDNHFGNPLDTTKRQFDEYVIALNNALPALLRAANHSLEPSNPAKVTWYQVCVISSLLARQRQQGASITPGAINEALKGAGIEVLP